jgi:hypothetical protein
MFTLPYLKGVFNGRPTLRNCGLLIAECGLKKEPPKIRNPQSEIRNSMSRCFLRAMPLTPGHDKGYLQIESGQEDRPAAYHEAVCRLVRENPKSLMNGPPKTFLFSFPPPLPIPLGDFLGNPEYESTIPFYLISG